MSFEETLKQSTVGGNITDAIKKVLVINCATNIPLAITSIIRNLLVLHAVWKTPTLHVPSMVLLCGLALSDLAVGAVVEPLFITDNLIGLYSKSERLKSLFMRAFNVFGFSLCRISLCTVTAVSVDRLVAIQKPFHYPSIVTIPRVRRVLVAIWIFCVVLASAHLLHETIEFVSAGVVICVCLIISAFSHVKIYKFVRHHQHWIQMQLRAVEANAPNTGNVNNMSGLKKSALNALIVLLVLIACYCPYILVDVVSLVYPINPFLSSSLASTVVFINSALNPFLYCWRISEIREVVKQTCHELICCK